MAIQAEPDLHQPCSYHERNPHMRDISRPVVRQSIQFTQLDSMNAELRVTSEDDAATLLWAAQWLDEHRQFAIAGTRIEHAAPDDEDDITITLVVSLHEAYSHEPSRFGPWSHGVPPIGPPSGV
jgi:hypothetical protein